MIVDVSDCVEDWSIITPKHITDRMEVRKGDILILHTGYHRYYEGKPQQDLTRYFCMHPGGTQDLARWMHDMQISWWGIDAGPGDHPINTTIRYMRPTSPSASRRRPASPCWSSSASTSTATTRAAAW